MESKKALITGITGQDGSYLAELLLEKGYEVHGIVRRASTINTSRIDHIYKDEHNDTNLHLHYGDLVDCGNVSGIIHRIMPDEIYNLAAMSHVMVSFEKPYYTALTTGLGVVAMLEAIRTSGKQIKFYQASSSEMFGATPPPQNEDTPFHPRSPYAVAKMSAHWFVKNYREAYNVFGVNGILFNHESPRRGRTFVTKKITEAIANIKAGKQDKLYLGNLDAKRDWGYAKEYVELMWRMMQLEYPDDYVIGTGETHSVKEFLIEAFTYVGLNWEDYVEFDERYVRPSEVQALCADASKAREVLNWTPQTTFKDLVKIMVDYDMERVG